MKLLVLAALLQYLSVDELELRTPKELAYEAWLTCVGITSTYETREKLNIPDLSDDELRTNERYLTNLLAVAQKKTGGKDTLWATRFRQAMEQETKSELCVEGVRAAQKIYPGLGN